MNVLGIDEATAHALLHVDEVQFNDTGDGTPYLFVKILAGALFSCDFQIHT